MVAVVSLMVEEVVLVSSVVELVVAASVELEEVVAVFGRHKAGLGCVHGGRRGRFGIQETWSWSWCLPRM